MGLYNGTGLPFLDSIYFNRIFDIENVQLIDYDTEIAPQGSGYATIDFPVEVGKGYTTNPFGLIYNNGQIWLLDENKTELTNAMNWYGDHGVKIDTETTATFTRYTSAENARKGKRSTAAPYTTTTDEPIKYIRIKQLVTPTSNDVTKWNPSEEGWGLTRQEYTTEKYVEMYAPAAMVKDDVEGYWEQLKAKILEIFSEIPTINVVRAEAVRKYNETRNCIRVGTFNMSANHNPVNWETTKLMFADYGLDFCGLQEVHNEYTSGVGDRYPSGLVSQTLPYVDDAPSRCTVSPWLENDILSRYPIESSDNVEYENLGGETRGYIKCVIKLPRYRDYYPDGDQYLSLYSTHFDTYVNRPLQARELCDAMLADTNRFVIATMDSNDFTANKDVWKIFTDAGFTQVHDGTSKTEVKDDTFTASSSLDQIFVNENILVKDYNIISSYKYPIESAPAASDHDLVYADLELLYGDISYEPINSQSLPSTVYHVTRNMTNVKDNFVATNLAPSWHYQSTLTAEDGYTISSVTVTMGGTDITSSAYDNATGKLDFTVTGDVVITAVAT